MGMADLGRVFRNLGQAGERRMRRKRSPRCLALLRTLAALTWTRAPGAGHETLSEQEEISYIFQSKSSNLPIDFVKIGG